VFCGGIAGVVFLFLATQLGWEVPDWNWLVVAAIGSAVAVGELASRYRDEPTKAIFSLSAGIYVLLNASAAMLALVIGRSTMGWGTAVSGGKIDWPHVLQAGFGAMIILRSSVFKVHVGNKDVDVGPSAFLQSIIDAADRAVDRTRARERAWTVARIMEGVASDKALSVLPSYIRALMQNSSDDDRKKFETAIDDIGKANAASGVQALMLGLAAMNYSGEGVLAAAVASVAAQIHESTVVAEDAATGAAKAAEVTQRATGAVESALQSGLATAVGNGIEPDHVTAALVAAKEASAAAKDTVQQTAKTSAATKDTAALADDLSGVVAPSLSDAVPNIASGFMTWIPRRLARKRRPV